MSTKKRKKKLQRAQRLAKRPPTTQRPPQELLAWQGDDDDFELQFEDCESERIRRDAVQANSLDEIHKRGRALGGGCQAVISMGPMIELRFYADRVEGKIPREAYEDEAFHDFLADFMFTHYSTQEPYCSMLPHLRERAVDKLIENMDVSLRLVRLR